MRLSFISEATLLKAHKKLVTVPGHVRRGKWIDPYQMNVLVSDDHDTDKVANGQGSFYQKQAHKKLAEKVEGFATMSPDAKSTLVMAHATKLQAEASQSAALSQWKKLAAAGQNPKGAMWAAFNALEGPDQAHLLSQLPSAAHLVNPAKANGAQPVPAAPAPEVAVPVPFGPTADTPVPPNIKAVIDKIATVPIGDVAGAKLLLDQIIQNNVHNPHIQAYAKAKLPKPEPTLAAPAAASAAAAAPVVTVSVPPDQIDPAAAVAAFESGAYYQKEAIKKLKAEHGAGWAAMHPAQQHELALAKYKALQGAASQAAAVSGWKKSLLAGKPPKPAELAAVNAVASASPEKAAGLIKQVTDVIGADKFIALVSQANAKAAKAKAAVSQAAPAAPAPEPTLVAPEPVAPEPPVAAVAPAAPVEKKKLPVFAQLFTNTTEGHNKQWSVSVHGAVMKTAYGKIGAKGQTTEKVFASPEAAGQAASKLILEKTAGGYKFAGSTTHVHEELVLVVPAAASVNAPAAAPGPVPPKTQNFNGTGKAMVTAYAAEDAGELQSLVENLSDSPEGDAKAWAAYGTAALAALGASTDGPKEGDTKQGADGTLVFKDGRWHKQGAPDPFAALSVPDFSEEPPKWAKAYAEAAAKLLETAQVGGSKLSMFLTHHKTGAMAGGVSLTFGTIKLKCPGNSQEPRHIKMLAFVKAVEAAKAAKFGKKAEPAAPKVVVTSPPAAAVTPKNAGSAKTLKVGAASAPSIDGWAKTGAQAGSNAGGKFKDKNGVEWYCKFPDDKDVALNEILAAKFYQMLGVKVPVLKLVSQGGKVGLASKWVDGMTKGSAATLAKAKGAHEAFAIDAWLANWDVVGMSNDNLMLDKNGEAVRVDSGGSLAYRAMGGVKGDAFGDSVPELETLLDPKTNSKSAAVFSGISKEAMQSGARQLNKLKPSQIESMCQKIGPGSEADKAALAKKLIARRAFILAKLKIDDQWTTVKALDPTSLPVNPADLPAPIDFANLNGPGKGLSSKAHVNAQNTKDSEALIAFAQKGNLTALKNYQYDAVDKETGASLGKKSIIDHPASKLKEQWAGLIELLQSIATPPLPTLDMPSIGAAGSLEEISDFVGSFNPLDRVETVSAENRMGFFMALSHIDDIHDLVADLAPSFLKPAGQWAQKTKAGFSALSSAVRAYIAAVQSSGWINHVFSQGKATVAASGNGGKYSGGVQSLAAQIYADAIEIPEGTVLRRGMTDQTAGKSMTAQFLNAKPGLVIQNTDSMCTSFNESHSWGGDIQMVIRCAKGCKVTPSFASGNFSSEYEITTLPGQRFVVLSVEKVGKSAKVEVLMLPPHDGYVEELGKLQALGKAILVLFKELM